MGPVVEQLLMWILDKVLTPDVIKGAEVEFVAFLQSVADKSSSKIDDELVKLVALALGVNAPVEK